MKKFREWMTGSGRPLVMAAVVVMALGLVVHYFVSERGGQISSAKPDAAVTPKPVEETLVGGDSIRAAQTAKPDLDKQGGKNSGKTIHLGFAGDICLDDTCAVMRHMKKKGKLSEVISPKLIEKMNSYDSMVINNEFSISSHGKPMKGKAYTFRSSPDNVKYLRQLGVDVAGLANNHIYDFGKRAFLDTISNLNNAGIQTVGAGKNAAEARRPVYLKRKGKTIAVVAATRAEKYILTPEAGKNSPGVFRTYDSTQYVKAIKKAKKKADYVIAYVHWGTEYSTELEKAQLHQGKEYINAGADAVVGAHTHCLQGVGYYKGAPIIYSLGNFWFNEKTLYTTVLEIDITEDGTLKARMLPCLQKGKETKLLAKASKKKKFVSYVNKISTNARLNQNGWIIPK